MVPGIDATGLDTSDALTKKGAQAAPEPADDQGDSPSGNVSHVDDNHLLRLHQQAVEQGTRYLSGSIKQGWDRSYRAWRNEHSLGSKYLNAAWSGRSKTFRPKTRSAIRKNLASAAKALFGTGDVVAVTPQNDADQGQTVSATLKQELMNYR